MPKNGKTVLFCKTLYGKIHLFPILGKTIHYLHVHYACSSRFWPLRQLYLVILGKEIKNMKLKIWTDHFVNKLCLRHYQNMTSKSPGMGTMVFVHKLATTNSSYFFVTMCENHSILGNKFCHTLQYWKDVLNTDWQVNIRVLCAI